MKRGLLCFLVVSRESKPPENVQGKNLNMTFASVTFVTISVKMISNSVIGGSLAQESDDPLEALR